jgi:haloalkane dehalogenase
VDRDFPSWLARQLPAGYRRRFFTAEPAGAPKATIHFMEWGSPDGYPVLMQHGNPTWGFLYRKIVGRLLHKNFRFIVPDLAGLGFSSKFQSYGVHTLDHHAAWIGALIDALELKSLLFVGQDWGGPIGISSLASRPQLLKGLVILNTVLSPPGENFRPTAFHRFANKPLVSDFAFRVLGYPQRALGRAQGDPASIAGDVARAYRYPLCGLWRNAGPLALARMVPSSGSHPSVRGLTACRDYLSGFNGPTAIVWGEKDPVLGRHLQRMQEQFPRADLTRTGGGHFIQEEFDQLIANKIEAVAGLAGV